ncbi:AAA family ATPase [Acaryochloris sp. CCMEE 5410]|uniref:AAA family ATPase n=1 Tax=Acaryochloris sp. CCMEE 5410 TaxID=310037 RepID=UPI0002483949|nr:AAA family ATPase [Acaryochloris sp. CCMEE 5410]KAI9134691.1 AAA family ATPase [Acaryochloris sp. CCMEE 5410]
MADDFEILRGIYNSFDPFRPLPAKDPVYVDCQEVRGDGDILVELGNQILLAERFTHQLYTGHRGAGKSTELLRLAKFLEEHGFQVVYFAADDEDIDAEDAQYTDILLACTRHLLQVLKGPQENPVWRWVQSRMQALKELLQSEITLDNISIESQITQFAKLTATLKASPDTRAKIRQIVEPHTVSLIEALNQFIEEAMTNSPQQSTQKLVVIADNLDRITPVIAREGARSNHEQIFIDRNEQLKALNCHVIYTVPISLVYSGRVTDLRDIYDTDPQVLPMIMVRESDGDVYQPGLDTMKEVIAKRVYQTEAVSPSLGLDSKIFDAPETLDQLCLMSGGHVRNLMLLAQSSVRRTQALPITARTVKRAITEARNTYRNAVYERQWSVLAQVARTKKVLNDEVHRELLFNRCILEYRFLDEDEELRCWYDVHPLIRGIQEFRTALAEGETS